MKQINIFLILPLTKNENHFFISAGFVEDENLKIIQDYFSEKKVIVVGVENYENDWYEYFLYNIGSDCIVNSSFESESKILSEIAGLAGTNELIKWEFTILFKDLLLVNRFLNDVKSKKILKWKNNQIYNINNQETDIEWCLLNNRFLNNLIYEGYPRVCYLILTDEYISENSIINQSINFDQKLLLIEFDKSNYLFFKFRFKIILVRRGPSSINFSKKAEIIYESEVLVFYNENNYIKNLDQLFLFKKKDVKVFSENADSTNEKYKYNWIDEQYFIDKFKEAKFEEIKLSIWQEKYIYGIVIKTYYYRERYSDFGYDNDLFVIFGDSKYSSLSKKHPLHIYHTPKGYSVEQNNNWDYYGVDKNVFNYFFDDKKLVLINFDDIPYLEFEYENGCKVGSLESLCSVKTIRLPHFLLEDTFVLTRDLFID